MQITLTYKNEFGNARYYPDCPASIVIARLGGFKSFTQQQLDMMKREGWSVAVKAAIPGVLNTAS